MDITQEEIIKNWAKADSKYSKKINNLHKKIEQYILWLRQRKLQVSNDSVFIEYIRINYNDAYKQTIEFIKSQDLSTPKICGQIIKKLKNQL